MRVEIICLYYNCSKVIYFSDFKIKKEIAMKISVVTVCKNAEKTIENTLLSIYSQAYKNIEHIVIDGGSTDSTLEILAKYKDKITTLVSEPDTGIYNAMNKAIKLVKGDIVYFLNATDSLYDENVLEKVASEFEKHPDLELLWGDVQFVNNGEDIHVATFEDINVKSDLLYRNPCHQVIFYKSELFIKNGVYKENFSIYADYDFNIRMLVHENVKCKYLPEVLARFALGGVSTGINEQVKLKLKEERKNIIKENFGNNLYYKLDRFFTNFLGTPTKALKKSKIWNLGFNAYDKILQTIFKKQLTLNKIDD